MLGGVLTNFLGIMFLNNKYRLREKFQEGTGPSSIIGHGHLFGGTDENVPEKCVSEFALLITCIYNEEVLLSIVN